MIEATAAQRSTEHALGQRLRPWIQAQRNDGASWKTVADRLREATGGVVDLHRETLRLWFGDIPRKKSQP